MLLVLLLANSQLNAVLQVYIQFYSLVLRLRLLVRSFDLTWSIRSSCFHATSSANLIIFVNILTFITIEQISVGHSRFLNYDQHVIKTSVKQGFGRLELVVSFWRFYF